MRQGPRGHLGPDRRRRPRRAGRRDRGAPGDVCRLPGLAAAGARDDAAGPARRPLPRAGPDRPGAGRHSAGTGAATAGPATERGLGWRDGPAGRAGRRGGRPARDHHSAADPGARPRRRPACRARAGLVRPGAGHRVRGRRGPPGLVGRPRLAVRHRGRRAGGNRDRRPARRADFWRRRGAAPGRRGRRRAAVLAGPHRQRPRGTGPRGPAARTVRPVARGAAARAAYPGAGRRQEVPRESADGGTEAVA